MPAGKALPGGEGISEENRFGACPVSRSGVPLHSRSTGTWVVQTIPVPDARKPSSSLLRKDYLPRGMSLRESWAPRPQVSNWAELVTRPQMTGD